MKRGAYEPNIYKRLQKDDENQEKEEVKGKKKNEALGNAEEAFNEAMQSISERLAAFKQTEIIETSGVSQSAVSKAQRNANGDDGISFKTLFKIAWSMDKSIDYLCGMSTRPDEHFIGKKIRDRNVPVDDKLINYLLKQAKLKMETGSFDRDINMMLLIDTDRERIEVFSNDEQAYNQARQIISERLAIFDRKDIEDKTGIEHPTISKVLNNSNGGKGIYFNTIFKIARAMNMSIDYLCGMSTKPDKHFIRKKAEERGVQIDDELMNDLMQLADYLILHRDSIGQVREITKNHLAYLDGKFYSDMCDYAFDLVYKYVQLWYGETRTSLERQQIFGNKMPPNDQNAIEDFNFEYYENGIYTVLACKYESELTNSIL